MFCKTCGKQLNDDEMVCTSCGTPREATAPVDPTIEPIPVDQPVTIEPIAVPETDPNTIAPVENVEEVAAPIDPTIEPIPADQPATIEPVTAPETEAPAPETTAPAPATEAAAESPKKKTPIVVIIILIVGVLGLIAGGVFLMSGKGGEEKTPEPSTTPTPTPSATAPVDVTNQNHFSHKGLEFTYPASYMLMTESEDIVELKSTTTYLSITYDIYNTYEEYLAETESLKELIKKAAGEDSVVLDPTTETVDGREYTIFQIQKGAQSCTFYLTKGNTYTTFFGMVINSTYSYNKNDLTDLTTILNSVGDTSTFATTPTEEEKTAHPKNIPTITMPEFTGANG